MISMKKFYLVAGILMVVVLLANAWNLVISWHNMNTPAKIAFIFGSILFNLLLSGLFLAMWRLTPDMTVDNSQLDDLLKEYGGK